MLLILAESLPLQRARSEQVFYGIYASQQHGIWHSVFFESVTSWASENKIVGVI